VPREEELERGDVPAGHAPAQGTAADAVAGEAPERAAGARADDPVGGEARAALEMQDGAPRGRAADPVDRAPVEAVRPERDLERGDARLPHPLGGSGEDEGRSEDEQSE
jgi:hypothetical protein